MFITADTLDTPFALNIPFQVFSEQTDKLDGLIPPRWIIN